MTGVPFVLAFLTAFYTPQVGISCRTLTFTVYTITQLCQIALWLWAYAGAPEEGTYCSFIRKGGFMHRSGFYTPTDISWLKSRHSFCSLRSLWSITCKLIFIVRERLVTSEEPALILYFNRQIHWVTANSNIA